MNKWLGLPLLLLVTLLAATSSAFAIDCSSKIELPSRPNFAGQGASSTFFADIVKYKNTKRKQQQQQHSCPDLYQPAPQPKTPPLTLNQTVMAAAESSPGDSNPAPTAGNARNIAMSSIVARQGSPFTDMTNRSPLSNVAQMPATQLASTSIDSPLAFLNGRQTPQTLPPLPFDVIEALNSGDAASKVLKSYIKRQLPAQENAFAQILETAINGLDNLIGDIIVTGNLEITTNAQGDLTKISGIVRTESCLSSGCPIDESNNLVLSSNPSW